MSLKCSFPVSMETIIVAYQTRWNSNVLQFQLCLRSYSTTLLKVLFVIIIITIIIIIIKELIFEPQSQIFKKWHFGKQPTHPTIPERQFSTTFLTNRTFKVCVHAWAPTIKNNDNNNTFLAILITSLLFLGKSVLCWFQIVNLRIYCVCTNFKEVTWALRNCDEHFFLHGEINLQINP